MTHDIIVCEDNDLDSHLICLSLVEAGGDANLHVASDGEQAMGFFARIGNDMPLPDLIVLDLNLPRYSGMELLERIRSDRVLSEIPVAVVSGSLNPRDRQTALDRGANAFFVKPDDLKGFLGVGRGLVGVMEGG